jgi:hypothetical protein
MARGRAAVKARSRGVEVARATRMSTAARSWIETEQEAEVMSQVGQVLPQQQTDCSSCCGNSQHT